MNRKTIIPTVVVVLLFSGHLSAWAQTGTRIEGAGGKQPQTVIWFSEPTEITNIRLLIQRGEKQEAVDMARAYVAGLRDAIGADTRIFRYYGLSALCAALTSTGQYPEAIQACTDAIDIFPSRWQALSNRGVAHYMSGHIDQALQDYRQALAAAQDSEALSELIQHNIKLAEAKGKAANT